MLITDLVSVKDKQSGVFEYRSARNKILSFEETYATAFFPHLSSFPIDATMLDVAGETTAPRNASLAECCQLAFENNNDSIIKPEYLPLTFISAKEDFIFEDDEDNKYFYYVGIFDVKDSEPIEIPFTIPTIQRFFKLQIDIQKDDDIEEKVKTLTKVLQESELKAKLSIRFLQDKELFSFKLADLIISNKS
jgi:hypothetical protein